MMDGIAVHHLGRCQQQNSRHLRVGVGTMAVPSTKRNTLRPAR
jgi:hypothetical protein